MARERAFRAHQPSLPVPGNPDAPLHSFRDLLGHMATLTRNTITLVYITLDKITTSTPTQQRAFSLIGAPIPLTLK